MPARPSQPAPTGPSTGIQNLVWLAVGVSILALVVSTSSIVLTLNRAPAPAPTTAADVLPSSEPSIGPSDSSDPFGSAAPSVAPSPVDPALEAMFPKAVGSTTLTVESMSGTDGLGGDPGSRALIAALGSLGKTAADLEIADAFDESGSLNVTVIAFKLPGVDVNKLEPVILQTWLSTTTPGVTKTPVTLSGVPTTKVSYGDEGANEYVFIRKDTVFIIETPDQTVATSVIAAMPPVS
jgi:hypothetical protein